MSNTSLMKTSVMITSTRTYHGISLDVISSGLQKVVVRRSDWQNGQWYIKEWLLMKELEAQSEKQAKAVLSNLRNRVLEIMLFEDIVGFAQWWLVEEVKRHFDIWEKKNRDPYGAGMEVYNAIMKISHWGRKCRFGSDIRAQFGNGLSPEEKTPLLNENWIQFKISFAKKDKNNLFKSLFMLNDDTKMMRKVFKLMLDSIPQLETSKSKYKHKKQIEYLEELFFKNRDRKERFLYPVHGLYSLLYPNSIQFDAPSDLKYLTFITDGIQWKQLLDQHKIDPVHPIEDYVCDMHTSLGRKMGKNGIDFMEEGMKVIPEDKEFLVVEWRNKYIAFKKANPERSQSQKKKKPKKGNEESKSNHKVVVKRKAVELESDSDDEEKSSPNSSSNSNDSNDMNIDLNEDNGMKEMKEIKELKHKKKKLSQLEFKLNVSSYLNEIKSKITQVLSTAELNSVEMCRFVGQKVTCSFKQVVYVTPDYVYKGPYDISKGETCKRIIQTMHRYEYFRKLNINVPEVNFMWEERGVGSILWQKMEQVGDKKDQSKWIIKENIDEMVNGYKGSILDRRSFGVETGCHITGQEWKEHPKSMISALIIIFIRYVLHPPVGDSGIWNTLIRLKDFKVYCIDYEEEWDIIEKIDQAKVSVEKWYAILSPRKNAWSQDRIELFESVLGLGSKLIHPELLASWNDMKLKMVQCSIPYSTMRVNNIDIILCNV